ncbi:MAG: thiamine phosphate synthase [Pyrinomonadaceae bacterium]
MSFHLPKLYAITDRRLSGLSHAEQLVRLAAGGARLIQLREKYLPSRAFYQEAEAALLLARELGVKVIINDRVDIALALQAYGVHLGQDDVPPENARKLLGPAAIIGLSVHNAKQAKEAVGSPIDYLAAGPIFRTSSKDNPDPVLAFDGLREIRRTTGNIPLVAIGGINLENTRAVFEAGADAIAVIGALLSHPGAIEGSTRSFLALTS